MDATQNSPPPAAVPPVAPKPRRRWLRRFFVVVVLLLAVLAAAPHAIGLSSVREDIAAGIGDALGVRCRIDRLGFSWFTGIAAEGIELGNPDGFPADRPLLRVRRLEGDLGLGQIVRGRFDVSGALTGVELFVEQRADGTTNLGAIGLHVQTQRPGTTAPGPELPGEPRGRVEVDGMPDLARMRIALQLRESTLELRRDDRLLEALTDLSGSVQKPFASQRVTLDLDTRLHPLATGGQPGRITARLDADAGTRAVQALLTVTGLDLQRWRPLVLAFAPGSLTELGGVVNGTLTATTDGKDLQGNGELVVEQPRFAGAAIGPLRLAAERWQLRPTLSVSTAADGTRSFDGKDFLLALGFADVRLFDPAVAQDLLRSQPGFGLSATFDAAQVLALLPQPPAWLAAAGRVTVRVAAPAAAVGDLAELGLEDVVGSLRTQKGSTFSLSLGGITIDGADLSGSLQRGQFELAILGPPDAPDGPERAGPAQLGLQLDLRPGHRLQTKLGITVHDEALQGPAAALLRHAVPLLAGLDGPTTDFRGRGDLDAELSGPLLRADGEAWLQLLGGWSGHGSVGLREASLTPAPALAGLLSPFGALPWATDALGERGKLTIDAFVAPWTLRQGALETTAARWLAKGREIGVSGTTRLDGSLDYAFDLTALLQGHRDGERVLQALGGRLPAAKLTGSLEAPRLGLPDVSRFARAALEQQVRTQGQELFQKALDELLRKKR